MALEVQCPSTWLPNPKIVFCGEAPGSEEALEHRGFVGPAGKCLQRAASVAGIDWSTVSLTNVTKRQPPGNKFREYYYEETFEPIYTKTGKLSKKTKKITRPTQEYYQWVDLLFAELKAEQPNLIVACGNEALEALTGLSGITNYRGSVVETKANASSYHAKVLAVEHPSYIIRGGGKKLDLEGESSGTATIGRFWILAHDLKKAKREMEFPEIRREQWNCIVAPTLDEIRHRLNYLRIESQECWTLDVETRAGTLACFALGYQVVPSGALESICVPIQTTSGPYWSPEDELEIWRALRETAKANPFLCNQNIEYDIYYLLRYGVEPSGVYMDTMLAHSILYPEFPKGLGFLCSFYLDDVVYYKTVSDERGDTKVRNDQELWAYCCKDAVHTLRIVPKIDAALRERGLFEFYHGGK